MFSWWLVAVRGPVGASAAASVGVATLSPPQRVEANQGDPRVPLPGAAFDALVAWRRQLLDVITSWFSTLRTPSTDEAS